MWRGTLIASAKQWRASRSKIADAKERRAALAEATVGHTFRPMATKAERYRSAAERSGPKRTPRVKKAKPSRGTHNEAARVSAHAGFQLEQKTAAGRPSRKSTRKAAN